MLGGLLGGRGTGSTSAQTEAQAAAAAEAEEEQTGKLQPGLQTGCIAHLSGCIAMLRMSPFAMLRLGDSLRELLSFQCHVSPSCASASMVSA